MKIKQTLLAISLILSFSVVVISPAAMAVNKCGNVDTALISCTQNNQDEDLETNGIYGLLLMAINILTAGISIAAVGGVIYGSVLYMTAGGSADNIKKAIKIITDVVIGVVAYALMYAFLNYLIPGGILN